MANSKKLNVKVQISFSKSEYEQYAAQNPRKARVIKKSVQRGIKEYGETFRKLAAT